MSQTASPAQGVLSAEAALAAIRAQRLQAQEREALRLAGKAKLEQYRKLKASVMNDIENKLSTFTAATSEASPDGTGSSSDADPMVEMLLEQVSALMSDRQRLAAQCSTLQRENEQLTELVGYLSLEQQQLLEQQQQQQQQDQQNQQDQQQPGKQQQHQQQQRQQLSSVSDEPELEGSWYSEQGMADEAAAAAADLAGHVDAAAPMHTSSVSSMDAAFTSEDDISIEAFH
ncbi:hypothetical protein OEZ85_013017 [Tetradesmus obliquus]|uniref:Uncharacterized protein n=1 Tax=Tetradesmus obliquus TaxID=3088 RepID=A0ABY8U4D8_TETOB|nr:hypothetical protein OEZ85_013017 [Tetradesmus obliquus]